MSFIYGINNNDDQIKYCVSYDYKISYLFDQDRYKNIEFVYKINRKLNPHKIKKELIKKYGNNWNDKIKKEVKTYINDLIN